MQTPEATFNSEKDRIIREWQDLLRFPSISTDAAHDDDCRACAEWLRDYIARMGFEAELLETCGKPVVYGERTGAPDAPVILFYGHYDVQPVDPLDAWQTPPFEPDLRDGCMYARGAQDNKGQHFYVLTALRHLVEANRLEPTVKIFIEGEEECGSTGITEAMETWGDKLKSDYLLVTDLGMVNANTPTLTMSLRGIIHATVTLSGPCKDLHSGMHGGLAPNPATELCRLIAGLHDEKGAITVPGFYDGIRPMSDSEQRLAAGQAFDYETYRQDTGVAPEGGERGRVPLERLGMRPCIDVNGLQGGFSGPGVKTIIPARASAKLTARLAAGQDPQYCLDALLDHLRRNTPDALTCTIQEAGAGGSGLRLDPDSELIMRGKQVLDALADREATYRWEGASIPVIVDLARVSGAEPLMAGFGCEEDNIHAPNESFSLERFRLGYRFAWHFFDSFRAVSG